MRQKWAVSLTVVMTIVAASLSSVAACENNRPGGTYVHKDLTLCWAQWSPAQGLIEVSKDFTAETGIKMHFELLPWSRYWDYYFQPNRQGAKCDLLMGDTQWLGGAAKSGTYLKLNDFLEKEGLSLEGFLPATVREYSTWPKGSKNYYAVPGFGDALGWVYRKDWFERPEIRRDFKSQYGRDLAPPKTWDELLEVAKFFQGREIDGRARYGAAIFTERASEGITMGVTSALYAYGFNYEGTPGSHDMEGIVNSDGAVKGLEMYRKLYECCTPPGHTKAFMTENLEAYDHGQVAMQMIWFAFFPRIHQDSILGSKSGFFANPSQKHTASVLGGQGLSVIACSDKTDKALQYIKWFMQPEVQKEWQASGGSSTHRAVVEAPDFASTTPFAAEYLVAMKNSKDFWQEPRFLELMRAMQQRVASYVVAGNGTAKEVLDNLIVDWAKTLEAQ